MKITILGSCRQDSLYTLYPVTSIRNELTYPHYSSEIVQVIEFCKGISTIPPEMTQHVFRSGILGKYQINPQRFYDEFNNTELFVIEIASRISYMYNGWYVHHILGEQQYGFKNISDIIQRDLTDEEIEADLIKIKTLLSPKKIMVVSHIYTRTTGKRYELVKLLEKLCSKHTIPFFDPSVQLKDSDQEKLYVNEALLSHYTPYGHSEVAIQYGRFIKKITKTVICFHNEYHIGDAIMILRFLYINRIVLKDKNIIVHYFYSDYCGKLFLKELEKYSVQGTIELFPFGKKPNTSIRLWIGYNIDGISHWQWTEYFNKFYKKIQSYLMLESYTIDCNIWQYEPYLLDIYNCLSNKYKNIDILIINSEAKSGQYNKDLSEMNELCRFLNKNYNIVTTTKIDNITCTIDDNLSLQDIGALSTNANYVIAIMTGPICSLYNTFTKQHVKKWFIITTNGHHYTHNDIDYNFITDGNLTSIYAYFKDPKV